MKEKILVVKEMHGGEVGAVWKFEVTDFQVWHKSIFGDPKVNLFDLGGYGLAAALHIIDARADAADVITLVDFS